MTNSTQTQTSTQTSANAMQLAPYVFFYGRCEEALEFYKRVLGGTYELQRNTELPKEYADSISADFKNKVMHSTFTAPGISFMASDGREAKSVDPDDGNISLGLSVNDSAKAEQVFKALAEGGKTTMPLDDAFWGGKFGIIQDRFGVEWMLTSP